jgi:hypothetical protein
VSAAAGHERPLAQTALQFIVALGVAVFAGGFAFYLLGTLVTLIMRGSEGVDTTPEAVAGAILFSIVLIGLFGGIPGAIIGLVLVHYRVRSLGVFVAAGIAASLLAPLTVMALTPLGIDGWSMLIIAIPSGAIAAAAAWFYLHRYTTLLASQDA